MIIKIYWNYATHHFYPQSNGQYGMKREKRVNFPSYNSNKFHNSNMFTNSYITIHTIFLHTKEERLKNRDFFSINVNAIAV